MMTRPILAIIVPIYNEEGDALEKGSSELLKILTDLQEKQLISSESRIVFVDDGSNDSSWEMICKYATEDKRISGLHFGTNYGQQSAILAGLFEISADIYISIDVDLQDDIAKIEEMVTFYRSGKDVVYGVRSDRRTDRFFRRWSAELYYKIMSILGVPMVPNHSEFRLLSRRAVDILNQKYPERNLFLRATIAGLGLPSEKVYYKRKTRSAGRSKYNFFKLFHLMMNGLTSYSNKLLNLIVLGALVFMGIAFFIFVYIGYSYFSGKSISGWASILASLYFVGGCIMGSLAILAEYISRIYIETKKRPQYIVAATTLDSKSHDTSP